MENNFLKFVIVDNKHRSVSLKPITVFTYLCCTLALPSNFLINPRLLFPKIYTPMRIEINYGKMLCVVVHKCKHLTILTV